MNNMARKQPVRFVFKERTLKQYPLPTSGSTIVYDLHSPLAMRVTARGAKSFVLYRRVAGRPVKLGLGRIGETLLETARREAKRAVGAIATGCDLIEERRRARAAGTTLAQLWDMWRQRRWHELRPRTRDSFESNWRLNIEPVLGNVRIDKLRRSAIQHVVDDIAGTGRRATARKSKAIVALLLGEAVRRDLLQINVAAAVDVPPPAQRERILTMDERTRLVAAIKQAAQPWNDLLMLLLMTGARVGNVIGMQWADLDLEAGVWRIPASKSKSKRTMTLPLSSGAIAILVRRRNWRAGEPWVFPGFGKAGHVARPVHLWKDVLEQAGIGGARMHDLRRSFGTQMAAMGASELVIGKALGHVSSSSTRIYTRLANEHIRSAVDGAAAAMTDRAELAAPIAGPVAVSIAAEAVEAAPVLKADRTTAS
jgi:integrase